LEGGTNRLSRPSDGRDVKAMCKVLSAVIGPGSHLSAAKLTVVCGSLRAGAPAGSRLRSQEQSDFSEPACWLRHPNDKSVVQSQESAFTQQACFAPCAWAAPIVHEALLCAGHKKLATMISSHARTVWLTLYLRFISLSGRVF